MSFSWLLVGLAAVQGATASYQTIRLPNDAVVLVERTPKASMITIQLFASSKFVPEATLTHGYRHLLEHLMATASEADKELEAAGGLMEAQTYRDCMKYEIIAPSGALDAAVVALRRIVTPHTYGQDQIATEVSTIRQELALQDDADNLANAGWKAAYGEDGLSPGGDLDVMAQATPEDIQSVQAATFCGPAVAVVVAGDVDTAVAAKLTADAIAALPRSPDLPESHRPEGKPGNAQVQASGEARCALVGGFDRPSCAARMAAALALASQLDGAFVTYTPTLEPGLVTLGRTDAGSGLAEYIDGLKREDMEPLYQRGIALARRWYQIQMSTPAAEADLRARLLCANDAIRPDAFLNQLNAVSLENFLDGVRAFQVKNAVTVLGGP